MDHMGTFLKPALQSQKASSCLEDVCGSWINRNPHRHLPFLKKVVHLPVYRAFSGQSAGRRIRPLLKFSNLVLEELIVFVHADQHIHFRLQDPLSCGGLNVRFGG
ncbi:hypothetical protein T11_5874 [Trichinella zimbabwensis]|uniref:Uncharacterized protein n=1 Tax=Trichinella zimbabwensis TaxID=268475 RepID=A0A0V1H608_9BILA|nr:hypothetical protein T11_5874 [Trichinella zimbabwensis]